MNGKLLEPQSAPVGGTANGASCKQVVEGMRVPEVHVRQRSAQLRSGFGEHPAQHVDEV